MRFKNITLAILTIMSMGGVSRAIAEESSATLDESWYIVGAVGQTTGRDTSTPDKALSSVGATEFSSSISTPTFAKLDIGYQVTKNFAVELGYLTAKLTYNASGGNLTSPTSSSVDITGWSLVQVGIWPISNRFSLLGKLGIADIGMSATITGPSGNTSLNGAIADRTYGIGLKYDITPAVSTRVNIDNYRITASNNNASSRSKVWMVGLGYKF